MPRKSKSKEVAGNVWQRLFRPKRGQDEDEADPLPSDIANLQRDEPAPVEAAVQAPVDEEADASNTFAGAGDFVYRFDPETESYTIVEAPEQHQNLVGVTVRPGSRAYDSIRAEHQTGQSLWEAEEEAAIPDPLAAADVDPAGSPEPVAAGEPGESPTAYTPSGDPGESGGYMPPGEPGESELTVEDWSQIPGESSVDQPAGLEHLPFNLEDDPYFPGVPRTPAEKLRAERELIASRALHAERMKQREARLAQKKAEEEAAWLASDERAHRSAAAARGEEYTGHTEPRPGFLQSGPYRGE